MFSYFPVKYLLYYRNPLEAIQAQMATIYKFSLCQYTNFGNLNEGSMWLKSLKSQLCCIFHSKSNFFSLDANDAWSFEADLLVIKSSIVNLEKVECFDWFYLNFVCFFTKLSKWLLV